MLRPQAVQWAFGRCTTSTYGLFPHADRAVLAAGGDLLGGRVVGDGKDLVFVAFPELQFLAAGDVPQAERAIAARRDDPVAIAEDDRIDRAVVAGETLQLFDVLGVKDFDRAVRAGSGQALAALVIDERVDLLFVR